MAYTINLTGATGNITPITINDGTIDDTQTSLVLVGKNYAGYGQFLDQNFVDLLQSSIGTTPPGTPLTGQLWWDTGTGSLNVYNGTIFKSLASTTSSSSAPTTTNVQGDLWYDTVNAQLKVWTGTQWLLVGPQFTSGTGITGAIPTTILDTTGASHVVTELLISDTIVGIISKDSGNIGFTPSPSIGGFSTVRAGINLSTAVAGAEYWGTANNSSYLNGLTGNSFMRTDSNTGTTGTLTLGAGIINSAGNGVSNIGSSSAYFNTVFATATSAYYADVAERFAADQVLDAGTVVELGGSAEITKSQQELSENVFGVISTRAAYLMNGGAGTNDTHPPVAMTGRVPVQVTGTVRKGDRLVSAGNGHARAAMPGEATAFNVIGRALVDKPSSGFGTVEAIVTIK